MPAATTVRTATADDAADLLAFTLEGVREAEGKTLDAARVAEGLRAALQDPAGRHYFIAERDGAAVGMCFVTTEWSDWTASWYWWFQSVYVSPEHRRSGVFDALYEHVATAGLKAGVRVMKLYVHEHNQRAQRTYERLGMKRAPYHLYETTL